MANSFEDDISPTLTGLLHCLLALSEEAACLSLSQTFAALQEAIVTCRAEIDLGPLLYGRFPQATAIH